MSWTRIENEQRVRPRTSMRNYHLTAPFGARSPGTIKNDMSTGYVWYSLPFSAINGSAVAISLCFHQGVLDSLNMALVDSALYGGSWSEWTEEKERLRARHTEDWLRTIGYIPGTFVWGEVWAGYDAKGGNGHAGVRYFAPPR